MCARLATSLTGHAAIGHLKLDHLVQGSDIVIEGVESGEAEHLGPVLRAAIEAANGACDCDPVLELPRNMPQARADELARAVEAGVRPAG